MRANAQRDGRPAEYRWRHLFNAAEFGWRPLPECRAVALPRRETRWNLQGCPKLDNRSTPLVSRSSPYYKDMWRKYCYLLFNNFFGIVHACLSCEDIAPQTCAMVRRCTHSEFSTWQHSARGNSCRKCIHSIPGQEAVDYSAKIGWLPLSEVAATTESTRETRWNFPGCLKLANRSQPLIDRNSQ